MKVRELRERLAKAEAEGGAELDVCLCEFGEAPLTVNEAYVCPLDEFNGRQRVVLFLDTRELLRNA